MTKTLAVVEAKMKMTLRNLKKSMRIRKLRKMKLLLIQIKRRGKVQIMKSQRKKFRRSRKEINHHQPSQKS